MKPKRDPPEISSTVKEELNNYVEKTADELTAEEKPKKSQHGSGEKSLENPSVAGEEPKKAKR